MHTEGLSLARKTFGENNLTTAKYYGNLGRLFQTRRSFKEVRAARWLLRRSAQPTVGAQSEKMHLKAIAIKERVLSPNDYEVALSVGHLASLYNYDMYEHGKAEPLYLRSIRTGLQLFGHSYSGLEYDYRCVLAVPSRAMIVLC